jgi:hypothetical protein
MRKAREPLNEMAERHDIISAKSRYVHFRSCRKLSARQGR